jgi:ubiquinone/menaquinone biosynthesis C-methylase UbiE
MSSPFDYRRFYDRIAPLYALAFPLWRRYATRALTYLPPTGAILEIGPGPGVLHETVARQYPFTAALDLSPGMLHQTQRRLRRAGLMPRLVNGDAADLPFAESCFDGILLTFVFSAIPDGDRAMRDMVRVLRPGGVIALVDACQPDDGNRIGMWLARQWERFGDTMRDEAALMRAAGLDVIGRQEFGPFHCMRVTGGQKPLST